jgi:hypothetical protein
VHCCRPCGAVSPAPDQQGARRQKWRAPVPDMRAAMRDTDFGISSFATRLPWSAARAAGCRDVPAALPPNAQVRRASRTGARLCLERRQREHDQSAHHTARTVAGKQLQRARGGSPASAVGAGHGAVPEGIMMAYGPEVCQVPTSPPPSTYTRQPTPDRPTPDARQADTGPAAVRT